MHVQKIIFELGMAFILFNLFLSSFVSIPLVQNITVIFLQQFLTNAAKNDTILTSSLDNIPQIMVKV
jgi:hypothetical protein